MAKKPNKVEIRAFQVGFGDCFLLSFVYSDETRHVLIDFGSTGLPKGGGADAGKPSKHMAEVAKEIERVCGTDKLTAVVATHRHADHINGFGTDGKTGGSGTIIRDLEPKLVLQPWTEDPKAKKDAKSATSGSKRSAKGFTTGLAAKQQVARAITELAANPPAWMSASLRRELSDIGMTNIANASAVKNLIAMGRAKGSKAVFARYGDASGLEELLPGVRVHVLGPPDLTQTENIRKQRARDPDQFWHLMGKNRASLAGVQPAADRGPNIPVEARWFQKRLTQMRGSQLLEIVRELDAEMNNTSLILLFEVFGKKLLFPGDAQIENWSYALEDAPEAAKTKKTLADVDVYKVGHHGSLNATPRKLLWDAFQKRGAKKALKTLLSTMPGKHGKSASRTEVPRRTLLNALETESTLFNTNDLSFTAKNKELSGLTTIEP